MKKVKEMKKENQEIETIQPLQSYHGLSVKEKDDEIDAILTRLMNKKPDESIPIANTLFFGMEENKVEMNNIFDDVLGWGGNSAMIQDPYMIINSPFLNFNEIREILSIAYMTYSDVLYKLYYNFNSFEHDRRTQGSIMQTLRSNSQEDLRLITLNMKRIADGLKYVYDKVYNDLLLLQGGKKLIQQTKNQYVMFVGFENVIPDFANAYSNMDIQNITVRAVERYFDMYRHKFQNLYQGIYKELNTNIYKYLKDKFGFGTGEYTGKLSFIDKTEGKLLGYASQELSYI